MSSALAKRIYLIEGKKPVVHTGDDLPAYVTLYYLAKSVSRHFRNDNCLHYRIGYSILFIVESVGFIGLICFDLLQD